MLIYLKFLGIIFVCLSARGLYEQKICVYAPNAEYAEKRCFSRVPLYGLIFKSREGRGEFVSRYRSSRKMLRVSLMTKTRTSIRARSANSQARARTATRILFRHVAAISRTISRQCLRADIQTSSSSRPTGTALVSFARDAD